MGRHRVWILLGLVVGLLSTSLAPGCRDFSSASPSRSPDDAAGAGGNDQGSIEGAVAGAAGHDASPAGGGRADAGAGGQTTEGGGTGQTTGSAGASGGANESSVEFSGRELDVTIHDPFEAGAGSGWNNLMPFWSEDAPHFIAYTSVSGAVSFRKLGQDRQSEEHVWSGEWPDRISAFLRLAPENEQTVVTYRPSTGLRELWIFEPNLQGLAPLDDVASNIGTAFTHHASDVATTLGLPSLYWYDANTGALSQEVLNTSASNLAGSFTYELREGYAAIAALDGRVLGFGANYVDVFDANRLGPSPDFTLPPIAAERLLAFELEGVKLLFCYHLSLGARILELAWGENEGGIDEAWTGTSVIRDARSVAVLPLEGEALIFLYADDPQTPVLQVLTVTLAPQRSRPMRADTSASKRAM